jgi:hypothetical protein
MENLSTYPLRPIHWLALMWEKNQQLIIRTAIILGVLLVSAGLGRKASLLYLMLPFGIGAILLFIQRPALGLLLSLIGGFAVPFSGPSGLNVTMLGVALLLILWIMEMLVRRQSIQLMSSYTTRPAFWLILISILAFGVGQLSWYHTDHAPMGAQLGGLFIIILSVGAFLLVGNRVSLYWLQWFTWVFLAYSSLYIIGWPLPAITKYTNHLFQLGSTGSLFWLWAVSLAFSQAVFNRDLRLRWRFCLGIYAFLVIFTGAYYLYDWKSGWVPPLVSIGAMVGLLSPQLGIVMAFLSTFPAPRLLNDVIGSDEYSYGTRLDAWRIVLQITKADPILGLGPANYHWYTPLFPIRGYAVKFNSHSQYIDLIAQTGVLGLFCFLWFTWAIGRLCWRLRAQAPSGFAQAYVYGAFGGLIGTVVAGTLGDWVLPFFYNVGMNGFRASILTWIFLGGLVVIEKIAARQPVAS